MAIKKGIVVLDGTTEVHKLTDDGNVVINAPSTATEPAELKGNVMVEGVSDDLVKTLFSLDSDIQAESAAARAAEASAQGEADQWYSTTDADFTARHGTLSATLGTATANRIADYAALSAAGSTLKQGTVDVNVSQMSAQQSSGTAYREQQQQLF
jgi:glucokinase